jgi:hypothetical protein
MNSDLDVLHMYRAFKLTPRMHMNTDLDVLHMYGKKMRYSVQWNWSQVKLKLDSTQIAKNKFNFQSPTRLGAVYIKIDTQVTYDIHSWTK